MQSFTVMERMVGLFILLSFLAFLGTVMLVGRAQNWFRQHNDYYAIYEQGYNIVPGVKVKLLRTDIGQVTQVTLTEDNKVRVDMRILAAHAQRIRADSKAAVESPTFIGSEFINILPSANPEAELIPVGGRIPAKEKKEISDYVEEFDLEHKLLLAEETMENVAALTDELSKTQGPLLSTLENIRQLTAKINQGQGSLGQVVSNDDAYQKIMTELETLADILTNIKEASVTIKSGAKAVSTGADHIRAGAGSVETATANIRENLPIILTKVQAVLDELDLAMQDVPDISRRAHMGMRDVNRILESVKKNILIRGNLPSASQPESHGVLIQGD